jgi:C-terminal processing protease CtpA/Prc
VGNQQVISSWWTVPIVQRPLPASVDVARTRWELPPNRRISDQRLIWLTDARAMSFAESLLSAVRYNHLGTIIGDSTAGTNGVINNTTLADGSLVTWTGMAVENPDGSVFRGVQPDIIAIQTRAGLVAGRDDVLRAALSGATLPLNSRKRPDGKRQH